MFGHSMALFGARRDFKMILSHIPLTSLNMSSYRAIWTNFRQNFVFFSRNNLRSWPKISDPEKSKLFLKCKSPHLAILIHIWHIWEDRSQKVNNGEPDLRFFHGNFWPVISHAVRKPCLRGGVPVSTFPKQIMVVTKLDSQWISRSRQVPGGTAY